MNGQEYLDEISKSVRPEKAPNGKAGILKSPIFKVGVIGVVVFIFLAMIGAVLGGGSKMTLEEELVTFDLYLGSTMEAISKYQPSVKSSELRADSASLYSVLSGTERETVTYLTEAYDFDRADDTLVEDENLHKDELEQDLFQAKITGILDRIFAHKMAYEISMIQSKESEIYDKVTDEAYKSTIESSYNSLETLYSKFNDFSE